jgi:hypothetical protein
VCSALTEDDAFDEGGFIDCVAQLLHDANVLQVHHSRSCFNDVEHCIDTDGSQNRGVLGDDFGVQGSGSALQQGRLILQVKRDGHSLLQDLDCLLPSHCEALRDDSGVDLLVEELSAGIQQ